MRNTTTKARFLTPDRTGLLIAVMSAVIFGVWPAAIRGVYASGGNITFALLITTWARALSLAVFCLLTRRAMFKNHEDTKQAIIGGFFQTVSIVGLYKALTFLPGPLVIIILFSHTLMLLFYMAWRGEIRLDKFTVTTTIAALGGLTLVLDLWRPQSSANLWGILLAFIAALATVSRLYVFGRQTQTRHPIVVGAENFLMTALFMMPVLFFRTPRLPALPSGWGYAMLGCVSLTIGTFAMFYGIRLLGSFRWSLFLKLEPIFTALFSTLFLNEILKLHQYAGIAVVVSSLAIYQVVEHRRKMAVAQLDTAPIQ